MPPPCSRSPALPHERHRHSATSALSARQPACAAATAAALDTSWSRRLPRLLKWSRYGAPWGLSFAATGTTGNMYAHKDARQCTSRKIHRECPGLWPRGHSLHTQDKQCDVAARSAGLHSPTEERREPIGCSRAGRRELLGTEWAPPPVEALDACSGRHQDSLAHLGSKVG
jgi:hypothetical protein